MIQEVINELEKYNYKKYIIPQLGKELKEYFESKEISIYVDATGERELYFLIAIESNSNIEYLKDIETKIFEHNVFIIPTDTKIKYNTNLILILNNDTIDISNLYQFEKQKNVARKIIINDTDDLDLLPFRQIEINQTFNNLDFNTKLNEIVSSNLQIQTILNMDNESIEQELEKLLEVSDEHN